MSSTRTIFVQNDLPIFEHHTSSTGDAWWVSVPFRAHDIELSDKDLINTVIQRLHNGLFEITKGIAMHHQRKFCVSLPVDLSLHTNDWAAFAIKYAEHYRDDIVAGCVSIDLEYIFGLELLGSL
ncbi:unnamed protein product [Penicillium nalgiovense]|uniref:Uncharacterized protein n=1 Tax=Penicillium nalgiovense TaxID=60175 RepID=A0A1V6XRF2_PENNA|nr:hypothetical protein PENNAL_c0059G10614 [Penicillium nalgiovense]CAG7937524.1 unnamed protein product [Penicillium nalgiovense]CAG7959490.1 unnamed protein product [Penicillium nalgiovense]CAG8033752.1 unnamed protein product [Penicillium nalgiovense]CAG8035480.1 unnamed protein product [Penicillium nalgiovense]